MAAKGKKVSNESLDHSLYLSNNYVHKIVPRGTFDCPDCGHALFWQDERTLHDGRKAKN